MDWPETLLDVLGGRQRLSPDQRLFRDLERLLNERSWLAADQDATLSASVLGYGLPLAAREMFDLPGGASEACGVIAANIERFEPRIRHVRLTIGSADPLLLRLHMEAERVTTLCPFVASLIRLNDGSFRLEGGTRK